MGSICWLAIVALVSIAGAQEFTRCNPSRDECDPVPAIGRTVSCDFTKGKCDVFREVEGGVMKYDDEDGAQFIIEKDTDFPMIETPQYMFFGRLEVELKAMPGQGLVTSLVLQSDALDEIDIEWVGSKKDSLQTNFFNKGSTEESDTPTQDRDAFHEVSNVTGSFHNYTVVWTPRSISWSFDGKEFRVEGRNPNDQGDTYPQTPSQVKLGAWLAGRADAPNETVEWAGGLADLSSGPAMAAVRRITITDFAGGDEVPKKRTKEYEYTNRNGTYQSIKVVETDEDNEVPADAVTSSSRTTTGSPTMSATTVSGGGPRHGDSEESSKDGLAPGAIAGIVIGCIVGVALVLAAVFLLWRRRKRAATAAADPTSPASERITDPFEGWKNEDDLPAEMNGTREPQEVHAVTSPQEMNGVGLPQEMDTKREPVELDSTPVWRDKPLI